MRGRDRSDPRRHGPVVSPVHAQRGTPHIVVSVRLCLAPAARTNNRRRRQQQLPVVFRSENQPRAHRESVGVEWGGPACGVRLNTRVGGPACGVCVCACVRLNTPPGVRSAHTAHSLHRAAPRKHATGDPTPTRHRPDPDQVTTGARHRLRPGSGGACQPISPSNPHRPLPPTPVHRGSTQPDRSGTGPHAHCPP